MPAAVAIARLPLAVAIMRGVFSRVSAIVSRPVMGVVVAFLRSCVSLLKRPEPSLGTSTSSPSTVSTTRSTSPSAS
jgi:hypothetical protein